MKIQWHQELDWFLLFLNRILSFESSVFFFLHSYFSSSYIFFWFIIIIVSLYIHVCQQRKWGRSSLNIQNPGVRGTQKYPSIWRWIWMRRSVVIIKVIDRSISSINAFIDMIRVRVKVMTGNMITLLSINLTIIVGKMIPSSQMMLLRIRHDLWSWSISRVDWLKDLLLNRLPRILN